MIVEIQESEFELNTDFQETQSLLPHTESRTQTNSQPIFIPFQIADEKTHMYIG